MRRVYIRPFSPPETIKRLVQVTCAVSGVTALLGNTAFHPLARSAYEWLSVSPDLFTHGFIWQPITSLFLIPSASALRASFLFDLLFAMLLFWFLGGLLLEQIGKKRFLVFYWVTGLFSALVAALAMRLLHIPAWQTGFLPILLGMATLWTMADPQQELRFFLFFPMKAKWVLILAMAATMGASLIEQQWVPLFAYVGAFLSSYLWGVAYLRWRSPFTWLVPIEKGLQQAGYHIRSFWQWRVLSLVRRARDAIARRREQHRKREERFIDETLAKISAKGQAALSPYARVRLRWISFKKSFQKHGR